MSLGSLRTTSFIPERFARKGKYLKLKGIDGRWVDGWRVESVGVRMLSSEASERSQDYKHQRNASDI
jgi:hypothetical protein